MSDRCSDARPLVLGREERFLRWASDLVGDAHRCEDLAVALRCLREHVCDLVLVYHPDLAAELSRFLQLVTRAAPDVPRVVVTAPDEGRGPARLALDASWVSLRSPPEELREALAELRRRGARLRVADAMGRQLVARLHVFDRWSRALGQEIGRLLHDLRTPIGILQGYCANLLDGVDGELSAAQRGSLGRMQAAIELLGDLARQAHRRLPERPTGDLPQIDRLPARRQLHLHEVCEELVEMLRPRAHAAGVRLINRRETCPTVWGDRVRLSQLLVNLLDNALRFTAPGGTIEVALEPVAGPGGRQHVRLRVQDSGAGIPPASIDEIFSSGWTSSTDISEHSGMGLAICREVAAEHAAQLTVQSEVGAGTVFELLLPLDPRSRAREVTLSVVDDPVLAGQLLIELRERLGTGLRFERPSDMERLADQIVRSGAELTLLGSLARAPELCRVLDAVRDLAGDG